LKRIKIIVKIILATIFLYSCTPKPLDIDLPSINPKIVVNTVTLSEIDSFISLFVSKSFSALVDGNSSDNNALPFSDLLLDDETVKVNYLNKIDTLLNIGTGLYISTSTPLNRYTNW